MGEKIKTILIFLKIIQVVDNKSRLKLGLKRMGKGYSKSYRFNPLNPASYIFIVASIPVVIFILGIIDVCKEYTNPFKWN